MQGFWTVLPMAVVMSAGPQIVTATFFATSADAKRNSLAFLGGVAVATTIAVTVFLPARQRHRWEAKGGKGLARLDHHRPPRLPRDLGLPQAERVPAAEMDGQAPTRQRTPRRDDRVPALPADADRPGRHVHRRGLHRTPGRAVVAHPRLRRPHRADRGAAVHRAPRHGKAGREHAPEDQGLDEPRTLGRSTRPCSSFSSRWRRSRRPSVGLDYGEAFLAVPLLVLLAPSRLVGFGLRELLLHLRLRVVVCRKLTRSRLATHGRSRHGRLPRSPQSSALRALPLDERERGSADFTEVPASTSLGARLASGGSTC